MYLGIDCGTSSVKSVLMDEEQRIVASASAPLEVSRPHDGWSEQDPEDWTRATEATFAELSASHADAMGAVRGIGLSGHMHGATLIDERDEILRPCMLWNDTRAQAQATALDTERSRELCGNILFPGFTAPKVAWVAEHEPAVFERVAKILLPKDYVRLWLTGEHVGEMSDASGTGWLDVGARDWSDELLAAGKLSRAHMPRLVEGSEVSGTLRPALAGRHGLPDGVVVAGGAGDNAASACGMGTVAPGSAFLSLGTSGVLFAANEAYLPNAESAVHAFCHALPGTWHQMGVILAATDALNWLARVTDRSPADLTASLEGRPPEPTEVLFLPYLGGERTPLNDSAARGAFVGLGHASDAETLTRAVLQGVAFAFRDNREALRAAGTTLTRATAIGGGSRSEHWLQLLADVLDLPLDVSAGGEVGASLGAARLALIAAEGADPLAVCTPPETERSVEPGPSRGAYDELHARYRATYRALKDAR